MKLEKDKQMEEIFALADITKFKPDTIKDAVDIIIGYSPRK